MYPEHKFVIHIITIGYVFEAVKVVHNHMGDATHVAALKMQDVVRDITINSEEAFQYILSNEYMGLSQAAAEHTATTDSIIRTIRKIQARKQKASALPITRQEIISRRVLETNEGDWFSLFILSQRKIE